MRDNSGASMIVKVGRQSSGELVRSPLLSRAKPCAFRGGVKCVCEYDPSDGVGGCGVWFFSDAWRLTTDDCWMGPVRGFVGLQFAGVSLRSFDCELV